VGRVLQQLAGRVWLYPADPREDNIQGSVAVIADPAGSVAVDAGNSPAVARAVQQAIASAGLPDVRTLVYTHHHWDHVWGACAWPGVEIVGHAAGLPLLEQEAARPWSHGYLRSEVAANPLLEPSFSARARAMPDWDGFTILPPHRTFTDRLDLTGDVRLRHVGGQHAPDSLVVEVPDSGVLLLGDSFYPPPYHLRGPDDGPDLALVSGLLTDQFTWYVDSHSEPHDRDEIAELLAPS
jgi:glyoxylase-like metal-dependent hydrolase (beta-lactamase superfamily II)